MRDTKESREIDMDRIVNAYSTSLIRLAFTYTRNLHDAEDVVQDVFLKLYTSKKQFECEEHEKAWLIRATIHTSINYIKATQRRKTEQLEDVFVQMPSEERNLLEVIDQLPYKYRAVIHLHYYEDYSTKEIAGILQKPVSTVCTWLERGRKQLKKRLEQGKG